MQRARIKKVTFKGVAAALAGIAAVAGVVFIFTDSRSVRIDLPERTMLPYDDRRDNALPGKSELLWLHAQANGLQVSYVLREGFSYPYAGLLIPLNDRSGKSLDCSRYDALKIRIASSQLSDCKLYFMQSDSNNSSKITLTLPERYLQNNLVLTEAAKTFVLPFSSFTTPEWWFQKNNVTLKDVGSVDFSKVRALKIESGATAKLDIVDTLTISGMYLIKRPRWYLLAVVAAGCLLYALFRLIIGKKSSSIVITYDKKEVRSYRDIDAQRIAEYIAKHFSESEISIISTGKALGLSQKKMAKIMNDAFKMSFKQYLTSIRICEAKRLLRETDRLVIDIALEVGFNNISHFNRVFKASAQVSPLEFRNSTSNKT